MPRRTYKKKTNTTTKVKAAPKRKYTRRKKTKVVYNRNQVVLGKGFPKVMNTTHTFFENVQMTATSGVPAFYRFSANGMFDPNITSVGTQPLFFDQLAVLYDHYTVIGSKITVTFLPNSTPGTPSSVGIYVDDDVTPVTDIALLSELPQSRRRYIPMNNCNAITLTQKFSTKKTYPGSVLGNEKLSGTAATNPSDQTYYMLWLAAVDGGTTVSCYCQVKIEYIAVWNELKTPTKS